MKRVLFLTNFPSPYRVHFFDELGKYLDVTVLYSDRVEDMTHRNKDWFELGDGGFHPVQLSKTFGIRDENLCMDVFPWLRKKWDAVVVSGYSSPTAILAMLWLRLHRVPFYMEVDGGLIRQERKIKHLIKRTLVRLAPKWISSGHFTTEYLVHYGAEKENVYHYPFTSLYAENILPRTVSPEEKEQLRQKLEIPEEKMILAIGQFIHRKGFDVLLRSAVTLDKNVGIYIIGGEATDEYRKMKEDLGLTNVHFLGFQKKPVLEMYYKTADLFVLPTREDIWGLVINEAMAYGLPVITTDRCVAGLELIEDGVNGYIVPVEDEKALGEKMKTALSSDLQAMGAASLETIRPYTLENMAKVHVDIFESGR